MPRSKIAMTPCDKRPSIRSASGATRVPCRVSSRSCRRVRLKIERAAAEALGRIGDRSAMPALLEASGRLESNPARHDRILEHSLTYALIEIDDPAATRVGLKNDRPWTRRAALIALDQMDGGGLEPTKIAALLLTSDPVLKEAASWIIGHHPEWGGILPVRSAIGCMRKALRRPTGPSWSGT